MGKRYPAKEEAPEQIFDFNGEGKWSLLAIRERYKQYAAELRIVPHDLLPREYRQGNKRWIYPVMTQVAEGIDAGDAACVCIGLEYLEDDAKFMFGKILKSKVARALRRATLTEEQKQRIRRRVLGMLRAGHVPHEFREYARLVKKVGFTAEEMGSVPGTSQRVTRFREYLEAAAIPSSERVTKQHRNPTGK